MLQNRIYRGEIVHKGKSYPGEHDAIIDETLWNNVQAILTENRVDRASGKSAGLHQSFERYAIFDPSLVCVSLSYREVRCCAGRPPYHRIAETRRPCVLCGKCRRNSSLHENRYCWIRAKSRNGLKNLRRPKDK